MTDKEVFKQLLDKPQYQQKLPNVSDKIPKDYIKRIQKLLNQGLTKIKDEGYDYPACYRNHKNEIKEVDISQHAVKQFIKRFKKVYIGTLEELSPEKWQQLLCYMVNSCVKENMHKKHLLQSRKEKYKHDKPTMYIYHGCFRFIVSNMIIVTSELRGYYFELN